MTKQPSSFDEFLKDVPEPIRASLEQLREITNAQTDFIAFLLLELEEQNVLDEKSRNGMICRWYELYRDRPGFDEHVPLADSIADTVDAQRHDLSEIR
ncbi:MAG: hypothetical protein HRT78_09750 [Halomonas sp.]|jgi:hypothetical protein|nr:hypothetical protein [Halomonas sp.]KTG26302.1 hypothetical protein AUR68_00610 [Idiomarina sp. H105]NQY77394.1 hypothetical protein [Halomonas sp.]OAE97942.1 hypothetical protein AWR38_00615 [Idiomarina sp. WRN-38]